MQDFPIFVVHNIRNKINIKIKDNISIDTVFVFDFNIIQST